jgi:hypothetical protein
MIHFYESDHLVEIAVSIAAEACKPECELREDHYLAYELLLQKIPSKDKEKILDGTPMDWPHGLILADLQGAIGNWQDALLTASQFLRHTEIRPEAIGQIIDLFINAAAAGYPEEALNVLRRTSWVSHLEPLITGIRILLGEEPTIAQEILEVGRDVAKRIEARRRQILQDQQRESLGKS